MSLTPLAVPSVEESRIHPVPCLRAPAASDTAHPCKSRAARIISGSLTFFCGIDTITDNERRKVRAVASHTLCASI